jgi:hypothetical protein
VRELVITFNVGPEEVADILLAVENVVGPAYNATYGDKTAIVYLDESGGFTVSGQE